METKLRRSMMIFACAVLVQAGSAAMVLPKSAADVKIDSQLARRIFEGEQKTIAQLAKRQPVFETYSVPNRF